MVLRPRFRRHGTASGESRRLHRGPHHRCGSRRHHPPGGGQQDHATRDRQGPAVTCKRCAQLTGPKARRARPNDRRNPGRSAAWRWHRCKVIVHGRARPLAARPGSHHLHLTGHQDPAQARPPPESQQHPAAWRDHRRQRASPVGPIPKEWGMSSYQITGVRRSSLTAQGPPARRGRRDHLHGGAGSRLDARRR